MSDTPSKMTTARASRLTIYFNIISPDISLALPPPLREEGNALS